ncbi:MAG: acetyl-CoA carboxylase, carboxyltransferase subunit beta [Rhabdochlamydiaceae bacterium]|nr:acetyl-CoA carboxylase, carboxyltransferase subunit beta [Candidatus Amphrikana amoebophyrae]
MGLMNLFTRHKPKIKVESIKNDGFSGWIKCGGCDETIHKSELAQNLNCCSKCDYHYRFSIEDRIELLADQGTFKELFDKMQPIDPLNFVDKEPYTDRIVRAQAKSNRKEGAIVGTCNIKGQKTALAIMDFSYMAGSMGSVVGEKLTRIIEFATEHNLPVVIVSASGGARMQESTLSLMQMAKTSAALAKHSEEGLPFISVLTNPTTGGVTASFASLGDIIIAEPKALIGFAGPRVVEQTIGHKLPEGAQKSEFLLEKGMIDCIVHRKELKEKLAYFIDFLTK